jgi:hypothetical protein
MKEVPVEAYNSVGKIEQYYTPLRQAYKIIYNELRGTNTSTKVTLQIAVKAINDSTGPDGIILIFLVFSTYPRITNSSVLLLIITKQTKAINKITKEIR